MSTLERVSAALTALSLPPAIALEPIHRDGWHRTTRVRLAPGADVAILVLRQGESREELLREQAGLTMAERFEDLPAATSWAAIADPALGPAAAIYRPPPGVDGRTWMSGGAERAVEVFEAIGTMLRALTHTTQVGFATRPTPFRRFVPRRASWRDEVRSLAHSAHERARARGTDLGPLSDELVAFIERRLDALDAAERYTLLHGHPHPASVYLSPGADGRARFSGMVDLVRSGVGDPLADLGLPALMPPDALAAIARGYGADALREALDASAVARVEAYAALTSLRALSEPPVGPRSLRATHATLVAARASEVVAGGLPDKLRQAVEGSEGEAVSRFSGVAPLQVGVRKALDLSTAVADRHGAAVVVGTLAAAELVRRDVDHALDLLKRCESALDGLGHMPVLGRAEPIGDRQAWARALFERAVAREGAGLAAALVALGWHWVDLCDGAVSDVQLCGLEALVEALLSEATPRDRAPGRLRHGLLEMLALDLVGERWLGAADVAARRAELVAEVEDAWDVAVPFPGPPHTVEQAVVEAAARPASRLESYLASAVLLPLTSAVSAIDPVELLSILELL